MPTITQEMVQAFAHCPDSMCLGNDQEQVAAIRERSDRTFAEWSEGSGLPPVPGVENTTFRLNFADEEQSTCPECGKPRELSDVERPVYPSVMKFHEGNGDPHYLLKLAARGGIHKPGTREADELAEKLAADRSMARDDEVSELRRALAELQGRFEQNQVTNETFERLAGKLIAREDVVAPDYGEPPATRRRKPAGD